MYYVWFVHRFYPKIVYAQNRPNQRSSLHLINSKIYNWSHLVRCWFHVWSVSIQLVRLTDYLDHRLWQILKKFQSFVQLFSIHLNFSLDLVHEIAFGSNMTDHHHGKHLIFKSNKSHMEKKTCHGFFQSIFNLQCTHVAEGNSIYGLPGIFSPTQNLFKTL